MDASKLIFIDILWDKFTNVNAVDKTIRKGKVTFQMVTLGKKI